MPKRFLFLEPHFSGSHKAFAQGLKAHSRHDIELLTLPGAHWKWRMRGAALHYASVLTDLSGVQGMIVSNMVDLARLKGFVPKLPPSLVYMHESQLTYPPPKGESLNVDLVIQEVSTALAADQVVFNSRHHRDLFLAAVDPFFARFPDCQPQNIEASLSLKSKVLYPGVSLADLSSGSVCSEKVGVPLVVWNHRWSYDKNFPATLHVLTDLAKKGVAFQVALLGESSGGKAEAPFHEAKKALGERVVQFGFCDSAKSYRAWLAKGDIVISSAIQENFGISVVEAMGHGCLPLLPHRLAYPEILPVAFHKDHLYTSRRDFTLKLEALLGRFAQERKTTSSLAGRMAVYDWKHLISSYDDALSYL